MSDKDKLLDEIIATALKSSRHKLLEAINNVPNIFLLTTPEQHAQWARDRKEKYQWMEDEYGPLITPSFYYGQNDDGGDW